MKITIGSAPITMLGRIMAGSQAVITHDETGQARFAAYYPPDIHWSQIIVAYCQQVCELTGRALLVIDRAAHSVALAVEFTQHRLGLLSMLDDNEYPAYLLAKIEDTFEQHLAFVYEDVCREICLHLLQAGVMNFSAIGRWWVKNEEIDLVALDDESKSIWFGECQWSTKQVGEDIYQALRLKAQRVDWGGRERQERFILFSRNGFTPGMQRVAQQEDVVLVMGEEVFLPIPSAAAS